ncbi:hypothetical protein GH714_004026 [Hevea brasiliensis]|uniref:Uncharacterized protein n=1 Tax=Hevea brasiliensis TaxID=3981 RepID=A0A6A6K3P1_HEVBR|nr:hypothetical protein GH714_004026 [Hevea brasiliensis]
MSRNCGASSLYIEINGVGYDVKEEARLQDMVPELKSLIAGLSKPDVEAVELVNRVEQGQIEGNVGNGGKPWGSTTKIEFPRFDGEELEEWLLRSKYFFEVGG